MSAEAWFTISSIVLVIAALLSSRISIDVAMVGGLTLLLVGDFFFDGDLLSVTDAVAGFAHPSIMLIAALFVVAAGLHETGGMEAVAQRLLGRPRTVAGAQLRLMGPVAIMSAFMNNTPIVAMYLPIVSDWARRLHISSSKLFIPLSFASILGGKITYIGTSANIVVMTLYLAYFAANEERLIAMGVEPLTSAERFWAIAWLGVPCTIVGLAFIALASKWLLPGRRQVGAAGPDARKYQVEMEVQTDSPIVGKTIEEAGLRHLPGLFLTQIERGEDVLVAVPPEERIHAGDRLGFAGILESVVDLRRIRGLVPATDQVKKITTGREVRTLVEAVVSRNSPLVGKNVRESRFRTTYNAAIIAVHRKGHHIEKKIGDIVLQPGDTLLLETHTGFVGAYRNSDDFYLVSAVEGSRPVRHERSSIAIGVLILLVILFTLTSMNQVTAAFLCAMLMVVTRCVTGTEARGAINWSVLVVIAAALGMGRALEQTGAAQSIAGVMTTAGADLGLGAHGMLFVIFALAALFAQVVNTSGAAAIMFPIAMQTAEQAGASPEPFMFTLMIAASAAFIFPVSYQTNLMIYGPGGYRFTDFIRIGTPLTILIGLLTVLIAPLVFPLHVVG